MSRALAHYTIHRLRRKLRDASGIQHLSDAFFVNTILVCLTAGGLVYFVQYRNTEEIRALGCYANLLRIERGAEARDVHLSGSLNLRYRVEERTTGTVIGCPDPNKQVVPQLPSPSAVTRWDHAKEFASKGRSTDSPNADGRDRARGSAAKFPLKSEPVPMITLEIAATKADLTLRCASLQGLTALHLLLKEDAEEIAGPKGKHEKGWLFHESHSTSDTLRNLSSSFFSGWARTDLS